eukprot:1183437-Prorocentrum_minimum.AAC.3
MLVGSSTRRRMHRRSRKVPSDRREGRGWKEGPTKYSLTAANQDSDAPGQSLEHTTPRIVRYSAQQPGEVCRLQEGFRRGSGSRAV